MTEKIVEAHKIEIPVECFLYPTGEQQIQQEGGEHYRITKIDFRDSFKTYIDGAEFPYEGYVTNDTLWATNQAKSIFIEAVRILSKPYFIFGTIISFLFFRDRMVYAFNQLGHRVMSPVMLKDKHISVFARELQYVTFEFMRHLVSEAQADKFSEIFSRIIDNDDAYKQRLKDMFSATSKEKLKNPREMSRLVNIMYERQHKAYWVNKVRMVILLLRVFIFISPSARKGYKSAIKNCNMDNLILHWEDMYWSIYKKDYDFAGMTYDERVALVKEKGWQLPKTLI